MNKKYNKKYLYISRKKHTIQLNKREWEYLRSRHGALYEEKYKEDSFISSDVKIHIRRLLRDIEDINEYR